MLSLSKNMITVGPIYDKLWHKSFDNGTVTGKIGFVSCSRTNDFYNSYFLHPFNFLKFDIKKLNLMGIKTPTR